MNLEKLATEQVNINTLDIDQKSTAEILELINSEDQKVAFAVKQEIESIGLVADDMYRTLKDNGRVIYVGAGTSGRLAVLDSAECPPTFGVENDRIIALIAGGMKAMLQAVESAEDSEQLAIDGLKEHQLTNKDMVIGIAASGRTPYAVGAVKYARQLGCPTACITAAKDSELGAIVDNRIEIQVGPEVITGSTRMKAGTAQKLVLNMLSSAVMIKLGRVYNNEMVSLIATNKKLEIRSINIIKRILNVSEQEAIELLKAADGNLKVAITTKLLSVAPLTAIELLEANNQSVKAAIDAYGK